MPIIDKAFTRDPRSYIAQSLLATAVIALILYLLEGLTQGAIVAALGASTFIVFAMPNSVTAGPRKVIGGHVVGLLCGSLCYWLFCAGPLAQLVAGWGWISACGCALAVGLSIFLMTITDTEHPPAAGTALGIVVHGWSFPVVIFVLLCAVGLAVSRWLFRGWLKDLT